MKEIVKILSDLIKFKTTADNPKEIEKCANYIIKYLRGKGMVIKKITKNGKISIVAAFKNSLHYEIIFNAHFDVVPAMSPNLYSPKIEKNKLYGRGSEDCKGQVAILMYLMKHFIRKKQKPNIAIMLTSDEEVHGKDGVEYLLNSKEYGCDFAIVADGGDNWDIVTKHKGVMHVKLSAKGNSAHASRYWEGGDNAIEKLIDAYGNVQKIFPKMKKPEWKSTACLSKIQGGDTLNKVPDHAELYLDIRRTEQESEESIMQKLRKIKGVKAEKIASAKNLVTDPDNPYIKQLKKSAEKILRRKIKTHHEHGATDARYFSELGIPAVLFKPVGSGAHSENEYLIVSSIEPYFKILTDFVEKTTEKNT